VNDDSSRLSQAPNCRANQVHERLGARGQFHFQDSSRDQEADFERIGSRLGGQSLGRRTQELDGRCRPLGELRREFLRLRDGGGCRLAIVVVRIGHRAANDGWPKFAFALLESRIRDLVSLACATEKIGTPKSLCGGHRLHHLVGGVHDRDAALFGQAERGLDQLGLRAFHRRQLDRSHGLDLVFQHLAGA